MNDFDWHGNGGSSDILFSYQPPTAVYPTKDGGICVRQKADEMEEYDSEILLTPQGALAVAWRLIELGHQIGLPKPDLDLMAQPVVFGPAKPAAPAIHILEAAE
jgi:hypothetical protein